MVEGGRLGGGGYKNRGFMCLLMGRCLKDAGGK